MPTLRERTNEGGFMAVMFLVLLLPPVLVLGTFLSSISSRNDRLKSELHDEQSLQAAEAGLDWMFYETKRTTLLAVGNRHTETLPGGSTFTVEVEFHYGNDFFDNDGDGPLDAMDFDEDVYRITSVGSSGGARRRIETHIARRSYLPNVTGS